MYNEGYNSWSYLAHEDVAYSDTMTEKSYVVQCTLCTS